MHFARLLQDFVADMGWHDQVESLDGDSISRVAVRLSIGGRSYRLLLEGYETRQWLALYLYAPFTVKEDKLVDACMFFNFINATCSYLGALSVTDDGVIVYRQIVDLDGSVADVALLYNMLHAAADMFERNAEHIVAIAASDLRYEEVRRNLEKKILSREEASGG